MILEVACKQPAVVIVRLPSQQNNHITIVLLTLNRALLLRVGGWYVYFCATIQYLNLVGTGIGYTITAGIAMV